MTDPDTQRDWPEDARKEYGICAECNNMFIGHPRRDFCKFCAATTGLTPKQSEHRILDSMPGSGGLVKRTTHPNVTYNEIDETFTVNLAEDCSAEVYGRGRFGHAMKIAEQQATIERLTALIDEHNKSCEEICGKQRRETVCARYIGSTRLCVDCPRRWMIDTQDGVK